MVLTMEGDLITIEFVASASLPHTPVDACINYYVAQPQGEGTLAIFCEISCVSLGELCV